MATKTAQRAPRRPDTSVRSRRRRRGPPTFADSWDQLPWSLRILRAFLGVTFLYAGIQKLLDPNFLHAGTPDYIGDQLKGFATGTPAAPLMHLLGVLPVLTGIGIALLEIAIGLATLLGVGALIAALAGAAVNVALLLSATWHVHPYFLGSDSIYAVAWIALVAGLAEAERARNPGRTITVAERIDGLGRREFLRGGALAGLVLGVGITSQAFAGSPTGRLAVGSGRRNRERSNGDPSGSSGGTGSGSAPAGQTIATLDSLPVGQAVGFTAPGVGPAVLVRLANDNVVAYSRVCTHAGCLVGYDSSQKILYCPCHGAEFDPSRHAAVIAGPTSTPLQYIKVVVDQATGKVILPSV